MQENLALTKRSNYAWDRMHQVMEYDSAAPSIPSMRQDP